MSKSKQQLYHPYCHLMNGERLYYLLIRTRTLAPGNRNFILNIAKGHTTLNAVCLYQVFGETDMILRIWAAAAEIRSICEKMRLHEDIRSVTVLLVKEMLTFYQREIERDPAWDWELPGDHVELITEHEFPAKLTFEYTPDRTAVLDPNEQVDSDGSGKPKSETRFQNNHSRFYVQCERPYRTRSKLFYDVAVVVETFLSGPNASMLNEISIYSYSNHRAEGVLIKGNMNPDALAKASNTLLRFVNECVKLGCKTTTNICAELIHDGFDAVVKRAKRGKAISKATALRELLLSYEAHPEYFLPPNDPDLPDQQIDKESLGLSNARSDQFITDAAEDLWHAIVHYSKDWWKIIEQVRLTYRWVTTGPEKNEQMIAVMMRDYARIESELSDTITALKSDLEIREIESKQLYNKLRTIPELRADDTLCSTIVETLLGKTASSASATNATVDRGSKLTFSLVASILAAMQKEAKKNKLVSASELLRWEALCRALRETSDDRNALMHGRNLDMFEKDAKGNEKWGGFVIRYLTVACLAPHINRTLLTLKNRTQPVS